MPANLPPQYFEAEKRFRNAASAEGKVEALEAMLAIMPKHKGTDHLQADLRRKIAKITEESERKSATSHKNFNIRKEGAGQIALVGMPNTGKSSILASLTNVQADTAEYPFTTKSPNLGMMPFENIQVQLVDMPAVNMYESRVWSNAILRNADLLAVIVDLSENPIGQAEATFEELQKIGIAPQIPGTPGFTAGMRTRKTFIIANKSDFDIDGEGAKELDNYYQGKFNFLAVSTQTKENLEELKRALFQDLDIIRVHTKSPGTKVDMTAPVVLRKGSTIKDAAEAIHKDFKYKLRYAVVWGSGKFDGQRVSSEHVLLDNDVIELHI
ncbi:MAG: 50S ribosome-binding GTPase [Dehalococcoidia bacterium]|nr:50S ribosome-binding GTPase [Dehalococcoidia bacterium]